VSAVVVGFFNIIRWSQQIKKLHIIKCREKKILLFFNSRMQTDGQKDTQRIKDALL